MYNIYRYASLTAELPNLILKYVFVILSCDSIFACILTFYRVLLIKVVFMDLSDSAGFKKNREDIT